MHVRFLSSFSLSNFENTVIFLIFNNFNLFKIRYNKEKFRLETHCSSIWPPHSEYFQNIWSLSKIPIDILNALARRNYRYWRQQGLYGQQIRPSHHCSTTACHQDMYVKQFLLPAWQRMDPPSVVTPSKINGLCCQTAVSMTNRDTYHHHHPYIYSKNENLTSWSMLLQLKGKP